MCIIRKPFKLALLILLLLLIYSSYAFSSEAARDNPSRTDTSVADTSVADTSVAENKPDPGSPLGPLQRHDDHVQKVSGEVKIVEGRNRADDPVRYE